jgi:CubicO group peptidase (beta-lactamase class C family)
MVCILLALGFRAVWTEQRVTGGPPPEIRALVDGVMKAINSGSAEAWEAMARERFSKEFLDKQTLDARQQTYEKLHADFGTISLDRVTREGPDAPLKLHVSGSTGIAAVISLDLVESGPPRISSLNVRVGQKDRERHAGGPPPPPITDRMTPLELESALNTYLSKLSSDDVFSGVALVAKQDAALFQRAYGFADRANRLPNTMRTRFNIGSINKTFTRLAIGQLVDQGKLAPGDTLGQIFPDYPQEMSRAATVDQLLNHTGGLADFFGPEFTQAAKDRFRSNADFFRFVSAQTPLFVPGSRNQYCNGCYIALGAIVERVSGIPYEQYVAQHIFGPAAMTSTGYPHTDGIEPNIAVGYTRRGGGNTLRSNVFLHGATGSAAGGGFSTAGDLLSFVNARRGGRLPKDPGMMSMAGGAPGISATVESDGVWTVVVLSNLDPPMGERIGGVILEALSAKR